MKRGLFILIPLVVAIGVLVWAASYVVTNTGRRWFERDVAARSRLALQSAREGLSRNWRSGDIIKLNEQLAEIARDERIMAAAACGTDLNAVAKTADYPKELSCKDVAARLSVRTGVEDAASGGIIGIKGGRVYVSALPIQEGGTPLGFVILVHDLSMVEKREEVSERFMLVVFIALASAASIVTLVMHGYTWRRWMADVRRVVRGKTDNPEFRPLQKDVRELIAEIDADRDSGIPAGAWTPTTLKQSLRRYLHGEKIIITANREPYIHQRKADGVIQVLHPASGLVTALEPVMKACSGVWIAHGSGSADRDVSDGRDHIRVPPGDESYLLRRIWLSREEETGYYYGFSNEGLWPLCHIAHVRPVFRKRDWESYRTVNERFADAVVQEAEGSDPVVLVQDYHFALLPRMLRERMPRATILTFWHIPWPQAERFGICPWHKEILKGMLGSGILGFHTRAHCLNFLDAVDRHLEARIDREQQSVTHEGNLTLIRPYPVSIEWPPHMLSEVGSQAVCLGEVLEELHLKPGVKIGVGVDRLDYTKGIEERLMAVERALELDPSLVGRFVFVQVSAPSRDVIDSYGQFRDRVEKTAGRINARFSRDGYQPVVLRIRHHEPPEVYKFLRAADFCYVSSLHDGMNLVAKEFVAVRDDLRGVLILSGFTGAARELTEALVVNPYDIDQAAEAIITALSMPPTEQEERMKSMRTMISERNIYRWAGKIIVDAARFRQRERLFSRYGVEHLE